MLKNAGFGLLVTGIVLVLIEGGMRLFTGAPSGKFDFLLGTDTGIYPPNAEIVNEWGTFYYTVQTNALGLRGPEANATKSGNQTRIVTIGDSFTDGFYVDNDATWPHFLQQSLNQQFPNQYEVLSAARGGGSINKELTILREVALPLNPDWVVLTFASNDISDLADIPADKLLHSPTGFNAQQLSWKRKAFNALVTRTAMGEVLYTLVFESSVPRTHDYRAMRGPARYTIPGGKDYAANVDLFRNQTEKADGRILEEPWSPETTTLLEHYFTTVEAFKASCDSAHVKLAVVYLPSYPQLYDASASMKIRDVLQKRLEPMGIAFCDPTADWREVAGNEVHHLAPADFHLNPDGNAYLGKWVAAELFLLPQEPKQDKPKSSVKSESKKP